MLLGQTLDMTMVTLTNMVILITTGMATDMEILMRISPFKNNILVREMNKILLIFYSSN